MWNIKDNIIKNELNKIFFLGILIYIFKYQRLSNTNAFIITHTKDLFKEETFPNIEIRVILNVFWIHTIDLFYSLLNIFNIKKNYEIERNLLVKEFKINLYKNTLMFFVDCVNYSSY